MKDKDREHLTHGEKCITITVVFCMLFHFLSFWFFQNYFNKKLSDKINEMIDYSSVQDNRRNSQYGILKKEIRITRDKILSIEQLRK